MAEARSMNGAYSELGVAAGVAASSGTIRGPFSNFIMSEILGIGFGADVSSVVTGTIFFLERLVSLADTGTLSQFIIYEILGIVEFVEVGNVSFLI